MSQPRLRIERIIGLAMAMAVAVSLKAQAPLAPGRWGKNAFISKTSSTLNGVKPIAAWIWDAGAENPKNYYLLVRKTFDLEKLPMAADAFISAYASADVYINGRLLERCPMNCDPEYQCYDHFMISRYLKKGRNCITAIVQNFGVGLHSQINARGGFFFQGKLVYSGNAAVNLLSDTSWKVSYARAWNSQSRLREPKAHLIGFVEEFDARLWPRDWQSAEFRDAGWERATVIGIPPIAPWNNLTVIERPQLARKMVRPIRKWRSGNLMVYDFGNEIAGYPQFTIDAEKEGVQFEIGTGERLDSNRAPLLRASSDHSEKYTTRKGVQTWRPYTWTGFRYFSIEMRPDIQIRDIAAEFSCYDYEMQSSFECSDPQLNEFWNIGKYTMRINSIDTYQDPWREHTQYIAGDSRYMMLYGNYVFGKSSRFLSAYNLLCGAESQRWRSDGAIRSRYPTDYFTQPGSSTYLADYQLEWVLMMHEYFLYYGKDELIEQLYPNLKKAMGYFERFIDTGTGLLANLPGWIVLDWPDTYPMDKKSIITGVNCLYYGALNAAAAIAADFGHDPEQAQQWKTQARQLRENINEKLWSAADRAYLDSYGSTRVSQQPQVYALVYGLPDDRRKADMVDLIKSRGKASEQSFAYWVLNALFSEGQEQWALDYMRKNWGDQTHLASFNGAWQEGWNLPWGSTSHAWSSGPTALLSQKVLGLEPAEYGWKTFTVKPATGDLMWAKGTVATVAGDISVGWQRSAGNHFTLQVRVPEGTTARIYLPTRDYQSVKATSMGRSTKVAVTAHMENSKESVLTVGAGEYQFDCETKE